MSVITTHVLDTSRGQPAVNVGVLLERRRAPRSWASVTRANTDRDGRARLADNAEPGVYRLTFDIGGYFGGGSFFSEAAMTFEVRDDDHYHLPLLATPFACSTYRGS